MMIFKTFWRKKTPTVDISSEVSTCMDYFKYKTAIEIRFADIDLMGHVNNALYATYMEISRAKYWKQAIGWDWKKTAVVIAKATITYIRPIHLEDILSIYVRTSRIGETRFDLEYLFVKKEFGKEVICSTAKTVCVAYDFISKLPVSIPSRERNKMIAYEQLENQPLL